MASFDIPGCLEEGRFRAQEWRPHPRGDEPPSQNPSVHVSGRPAGCPFTPSNAPGSLLCSDLWLQGREEVTQTPPLGPGSSQSHGEESIGIQVFPRQAEGGRG